MSGSASDPWQLYDLEENREVAMEFGLYMAAFAVIETYTYDLFSRMLGGDGSTIGNAQVILKHNQSFGQRLKVIRGYLDFSTIAHDARPTYLAAIGIIEECNAYRNTLVHGVFVRNSTKKVFLSRRAFEDGKNPTHDPISEIDIREHRLQDLERGLSILELLAAGRSIPKNIPLDPTVVRKP